MTEQSQPCFTDRGAVSAASAAICTSDKWVTEPAEVSEADTGNEREVVTSQGLWFPDVSVLSIYTHTWRVALVSGVTHSYFQLRRQPVDDILSNDANFAYFLEVSFALFKKKKKRMCGPKYTVLETSPLCCHRSPLTSINC